MLEASLVTSNLTNTRVQFFPDRDKVYIVGCGDYLVFGKYGANYELRRVANNEDTFVPTAVISIDPLEEGGSSAVLDRPNLLSNRMRFNMRGSRYEPVYQCQSSRRFKHRCQHAYCLIKWV